MYFTAARDQIRIVLETEELTINEWLVRRSQLYFSGLPKINITLYLIYGNRSAQRDSRCIVHISVYEQSADPDTHLNV